MHSFTKDNPVTTVTVYQSASESSKAHTMLGWSNTSHPCYILPDCPLSHMLCSVSRKINVIRIEGQTERIAFKVVSNRGLP